MKGLELFLNPFFRGHHPPLQSTTTSKCKMHAETTAHLVREASPESTLNPQPPCPHSLPTHHPWGWRDRS